MGSITGCSSVQNRLYKVPIYTKVRLLATSYPNHLKKGKKREKKMKRRKGR